MKLKLFLLLLISSLPFFSSSTFAGRIKTDDEFLNDPNTTVTIKVFEDDSKVKALVIGVQGSNEQQEERSLIVDAITTLLKYEHHDTELFSRKVLTGNVLIGDNLRPFSEPYTAQQEIPFSLQGEHQQQDQASLGQWYTVYQIFRYLRPDGTPHDVKEPLYQQMKTEETRTTEQRKKYCVKEETIISQWKIKKEHTIQEVTLNDIYSLLWQRKLDGTEEQKVSETKIRTEEKFYQTYTSCSECAPKK